MRGPFNAVAGLAIGLTITIDVLFGGPFTGAAMNPSRAFGPQLVGDHWTNGWVWYAGPLLGGAVAALLYTSCPFVEPGRGRGRRRAAEKQHTGYSLHALCYAPNCEPVLHARMPLICP